MIPDERTWQQKLKGLLIVLLLISPLVLFIWFLGHLDKVDREMTDNCQAFQIIIPVRIGTVGQCVVEELRYEASSNECIPYIDRRPLIRRVNCDGVIQGQAVIHYTNDKFHREIIE